MQRCTKCGGSTAGGFDLECRHDFGQCLETTLRDLYALADILGTHDDGCAEPAAAASHAWQCLNALFRHDLAAAQRQLTVLRAIADARRTDPHAIAEKPIHIERARRIRRVILLDQEPIPERPQTTPYAPRPPEMVGALRPWEDAGELLAQSVFHERIGAYGTTRFPFACIELRCPQCRSSQLVRGWCHSKGRPVPPPEWSAGTVQVRPGRIEMWPFCSPECARRYAG